MHWGKWHPHLEGLQVTRNAASQVALVVKAGDPKDAGSVPERLPHRLPYVSLYLAVFCILYHILYDKPLNTNVSSNSMSSSSKFSCGTQEGSHGNRSVRGTDDNLGLAFGICSGSSLWLNFNMWNLMPTPGRTPSWRHRQLLDRQKAQMSVVRSVVSVRVKRTHWGRVFFLDRKKGKRKMLLVKRFFSLFSQIWSP